MLITFDVNADRIKEFNAFMIEQGWKTDLMGNKLLLVSEEYQARLFSSLVLKLKTVDFEINADGDCTVTINSL